MPAEEVVDPQRVEGPTEVGEQDLPGYTRGTGARGLQGGIAEMVKGLEGEDRGAMEGRGGVRKSGVRCQSWEVARVGSG